MGTEKEVEKESIKIPHYHESKIILPLPIRLICKIGEAWELFICLMTFYLVFASSYTVFFSLYVEETWIVAEVLDMLFTIDVVLQLSVEIWRCQRNIQYRIFLVEYTTGQFLLDALSLIPFEEVFLNSVGQVDSLFNLGVVNYFLLNKVLRFTRTIKYFRKLQAEHRLSDTTAFLCYYGLLYIMCAHWFACMLHWFCSETYISWILHRTQNIDSISNDTSGCFLRLRNIKKTPEILAPFPDPLDVYVTTLYFIVTVLTTVGYGDLYSTSIEETMLFVFIMILGEIWITGDLSSTLTGFDLEPDAVRHDLFKRREGIVKYMLDTDNSSFIIDKIKDHYEYLWIYREGVTETNFPMHEEIMYDICREMFFKAPLFRDMEDSFLLAVAGIVEVQLYNPDMVLCQVGDYAMTMHYILHGECNVLNKVTNDNVACILRSGCIIGEINMFFSIPYRQTIETRTVCQILTLRKKDLMALLDGSPYIYSLMKERVERRRQKMRRTYEMTGNHPNTYVHKRTTIGVTGYEHLDHDYTIVIRKATGFNPIVNNDIVMDETSTYIVDMPCTSKEIRKASNYSDLIASPILIEDRHILMKIWVHAFVFYLLFVSLMVPYCAAFSAESNDNNICHFWFGWYMIIINVIDVFIEIIGALPVTGIRFQLMDGFYTQRNRISFYVDIISIIPFEYLHIFSSLEKLIDRDNQSDLSLANPWLPVVIRSFCKMWKIFRYFTYLENRFYNKVVHVRVLKFAISCPVCCHWAGCILFWAACPNGWGMKCRDINWLDVNFVKKSGDLGADLVSNVNQYIISLYFAASTITSVGFGDYTPQSSFEMICVILIMIFGLFFLTYLLASITSALTARIRPPLIFHQKFDAIKYFMYQYGLGEAIQERVVRLIQVYGELVECQKEHYKLQHQLRYEVPLPADAPINHLMYDAPTNILDDALYTEYLPYLEGVTIFSKCNPEIIVRAGKMLKRYLLPPSITFMDAGEVRREMYIVYKGSIALYLHPNDEVPHSILEATGYHGIRDLLYGEPCQYTVKTVGHVIMLAINYTMVHDLFSEEKFFMDFMAESCEEEMDTVDLLSKRQYMKEDRLHEVPQIVNTSWIEYPKNEWDYTGNIFQTTVEEFDEPFRRTKYGGLIKLFMLPFTINPSGLFATCWVMLQCINCLVLLTTLVLETMMDYRPPGLRAIQICVEIVNCLDIYVKLHWAYYDLDGTFYYHPIRTFLKSVYHGNFFFDLCLLCPAELIVYMFGITDLFGYGSGYRWYSLLRWGRFFRFYKLPEICHVIYSTFDNRIPILVLFYGLVYAAITLLFGMIAVNTACPLEILNWKEGDEYRLPACSLESWITIKSEEYKNLKLANSELVGLEPKKLGDRLLLGFYYVNEVILLIGYGDVITTRSEELPFLLLLIIFGNLVYQLILADLSASMIDSDADRHVFREQRNRLLTILKREDVPPRLYDCVRHYFRHTWGVSRGIKPRELFKNLHPILEGDLFQEFVGEVFEGIPLFQGFGANCLKAMCKFMRQESFFAGQRMARFGNMEFQLYVIVDGEVHITDRNLRWKCTLTRGEMFGELSLIYGLPRHYSAFAANNVEAYVISADEFADFLQLYPQLKENIQSVLTEEGIEYFEIKYRAQQLEDYDSYCEFKERITDNIRQTVTESEAHLIVEDNNAFYRVTKKPFTSNIVGFGVENTANTAPTQFLYFVGKYMLHPECSLMRIYCRIILTIRLLSPLLESYKVFFYNGDPRDTVSEDIVYITSIFEQIFFVNIILNFITALELERGLYCAVYSRVIANYMLSPQLFLLDFLSSLPVQHMGAGTPWLLLRLLRLPRYFHSLWTQSHDLEVSNFRFKISISGSAFFIVSHLLACAFFAAACPYGDLNACTEESWVKQIKNEYEGRKGVLLDEVPSRWYIRACYWVMTTLTTTGFGDIAPHNYAEVQIVIICMVFCALGVCIVISNLTTGLQSWYQAKREFIYQATIYVNHLRGIGLSKDHQDLLVSYYATKWHNARGVSYAEAISAVPLTLQFEVCTSLYYKCVDQCKFFGVEKEVTLIRNICARIKHSIFLPGNVIKRQGNLDGNLYVVFKGQVSSYRCNKLTGDPIFLKKYEANSAFGKVPALFRNVSYNKTYRAEGYVEVIAIHQSDIKHIAKNYPRWKHFLKKLILKRYPNLTSEPFLSNIFEHRTELQL